MARPERLRVVTLIDTLLTGGAERMAVTIASRLDRERFESTVCVSRAFRISDETRHGPLAGELEEADVPILRLNRGHRGELRNWRPLVDLLRSDTTHVLHSHKFGSNVWATVLGRLLRVPVIVAHEHGSERDRVHYAVDRLLVGRGADAFVTVSEAERRHMVEVEGLDSGKVRVIRNGIEKLSGTATDVRRDLGLPDGVPVIGTLAVLRPEKALQVLVEAAALLAPRFPGLRVLIAGNGSEELHLRALIDKLGMQDTVLLLGFRKDIADVLATFDVAVFSSDREGMPLAVIEAMAAGKAIVGTNIPGVTELIRDGEEGLLVPARNPAALAEAVARLLADDELRTRLGTAARERQRHELDIQSTVDAFEQLYDELFAKSSRGRRDARVPARGVRSQADSRRG